MRLHFILWWTHCGCAYFKVRRSNCSRRWWSGRVQSLHSVEPIRRKCRTSFRAVVAKGPREVKMTRNQMRQINDDPILHWWNVCKGRAVAADDKNQLINVDRSPPEWLQLLEHIRPTTEYRPRLPEQCSRQRSTTDNKFSHRPITRPLHCHARRGDWSGPVREDVM